MFLSLADIIKQNVRAPVKAILDLISVKKLCVCTLFGI
jgi:hypothetical protein